MSNTIVNLGFVPQNRGDYDNTAKYYKDNIVQFDGASYSANPPGHTTESPTYIQGVAPNDATYGSTYWKVFATGDNHFSTGEAVSSVGIDDEPTFGSDNLVKSGGVQNELALGAVYDVSAKNPTAGSNNDGKWESLSALLSDANLSTLIPAAVRKGGMSIKFIQSSNVDDHKYVQFMYVGTSTAVADFTNVANWELDVTKKNLSEDFLGVLSEIKDFTTKTYAITSDGKFSSNSTYKHAVIPVNEGEIYYLIGQVSACRAAFATSDESTSGGDVPIVSGTSIIPMPAVGQYYKVVIPQGCTYLLFNAGNYYETRCYKKYDSIEEGDYIDDEPIAGSKNLVKSGGISSVSTIFNFVGIGNVYVETQFGKTIAGHTYRIYPVVTSWDYGTTQSAAVIFQVGYVKNNDSNVYTYTKKYGSGGAVIPTSIDITIPSDVKSNTGILIGGRAASGTKVWFVIKDITEESINTQNINQIQQDIVDLPTIKETLKDINDEVNGVINIIVGKQTEIKTNGTTLARSVAGWNTITQNIPIQFGDTLRWVIGSGSTAYNICGFFDANDNLLARYTAANKTETDIRQIKLTSDTFADVAYVKLSYYDKLTDESDNLNPVIINGKSVFIPRTENGIQKRVEIIEDELHPSLPAYGKIGENYAEQIPDIVDKLSYRFSNRFHFLHLSDNHNSIYGYANELLDYIPAKFLVNTGDMVADKFSDSKSNTIACSISPTKPTYLVLGNHDYSHATSKQAVFDAFYGDDETEGTVNYHNVQTGGVANDKTYYSVDFATEGIKCIMLDMNEGMADADLPDAGPNDTVYGKMSQTQIEWFVGQLQDAITNSLHVCIFIHALPSNSTLAYSKPLNEFFDDNFRGYVSGQTSNKCCYRLHFLLDIVDAFINGSSVTFTYSEHEYTFTFASAGHFVAWFAGHLHYDAAGWLSDHENQFAINVCRPTANTGDYLGTYDGDRLGVHFNYVTVDKELKSLSVYRVGQQDTVYATQRKSFRIQYK